MDNDKETRLREIRKDLRARVARFAALDPADRAQALESERAALIAEAVAEFSAMDLPKRDLDAVMELLWDQVGDDLDYEVLERGPHTLKLRVKRCLWADELLALGAPDVGLACHCAWDYGFAAGLNPRIAFTRTKTLMAGDGFCDHAYELPTEGAPAAAR